MVAKVVSPPIRVQSLKFEGKLLNGVLDPSDNLLLAHKDVGKTS